MLADGQRAVNSTHIQRCPTLKSGTSMWKFPQHPSFSASSGETVTTSSFLTQALVDVVQIGWTFDPVLKTALATPRSVQLSRIGLAPWIHCHLDSPWKHLVEKGTSLVDFRLEIDILIIYANFFLIPGSLLTLDSE